MYSMPNAWKYVIGYGIIIDHTREKEIIREIGIMRKGEKEKKEKKEKRCHPSDNHGNARNLENAPQDESYTNKQKHIMLKVLLKCDTARKSDREDRRARSCTGSSRP